MNKVFAALAVATYLAIVVFMSQTNTTVRPNTDSEYSKVTAMIVNASGKNGGSGVILASGLAGSLVLTNKHVCEVVVAGGNVKTTTGTYPVTDFKVYPKHDLCLVKVSENLGIRTQIADGTPEIYTESIVAGHPHLLPVIVSRGHFSETMQIEVMIGSEPCTKKESGEMLMYCLFYGRKPIIKKYDSQVISSLIMPGSSGSGVFNKSGEIAGLVFAGSDGLSYAYIVPQNFVLEFATTHGQYPWTKVDPSNKVKAEAKSLLNPNKFCMSPRKGSFLCGGGVLINPIWSRE